MAQTDKPEISVVVTCYNGESTIGVVFDSLAQQAWSGSWEVVFVNNGSTDRSQEIVESYRDRLPALRCIQAHRPGHPHQGMAHTYSVGLSSAAGDAILLLDSDDMPGEGWLAAMARALQTHPFVCARMDFERLNAPWLLYKVLPQQTGPGHLNNPPALPSAYGCTLGLQRIVLEKVGLPDPDCGASLDIDLCARAHMAGFRLQFVPDAVLHYRVRTTFPARYRQSVGYGDSQMALLRKYSPGVGGWPRFARILLATFIRDLLPTAARAPLALFDRRERMAWALDIGWCVGRLRGAWRLLAPWKADRQPAVVEVASASAPNRLV